VEVLNQYGYIVGKYNTLGVPRAYDIEVERDLTHEKYKELIDITSKYKLVSCPALFPLEDAYTKIYAPDGTSISSNNEFLDHLLKLAQKHTDLYFLIRFKIDFDLIMLNKKLLDQIDQIENIEIDFHLDELSIYDIIHFSDLVIGKQTSVLEEAISAGKFVIYHDTESYVASYSYFINDLDIVSNSLEKTDALIESWKRSDFDDQKITSYQKRYLSFPESDPYAIIRDRICSLLRILTTSNE